MSRIKIMSDTRDLSKPSHVPKSNELNTKIPRYQNTGKPPLQMSKLFSPQGKMK